MQRELSRRRYALLIFDNCDDESFDKDAEALLNRVLPGNASCRVLVTTRHAEWRDTPDFTILPLGELKPAESCALLQKYHEELSDAEALAIAVEMGDLPLALHLAGRFLEYFNESSTQFLQEFGELQLKHEAFSESLPADKSPTRHEQNVALTFEVSFMRLNQSEDIDAEAIRLLARAACFAPSVPFPVWLLKATLSGEHHNLTDAKWQRRLTRAQRRLTGLGFLSYIPGETTGAGDGDSLQIHRLVRKYVAQVIEADAAIRAWDDVSRLLLRVAEEDYRLKHDFPFMQRLLPHISALSNTADETRIISEEHDILKARLLSFTAYYLSSAGELRETVQLHKEALIRFLKHYKVDSEIVITTLCNLAAALQNGSQQDIADGKKIFVRVIKITRQVWGKHHPFIAIALNGLGRWLLHTNRPARSQHCFLQAKNILENVRMKEWSPELSTIYYNLACVEARLAQIGKKEKTDSTAVDWGEKSYAQDKEYFGENHPKAAVRATLLGSLWLEQSNFRLAQEYFEEALRIKEIMCQNEELLLAELIGLCNSLLKQGLRDQAKIYHQRIKNLEKQPYNYGKSG